jgi:murein L,D-transpeptidase YcbB/YkuD
LGEGLADAVKRFQANHGFDQTGDVSCATLRELNIPAAARARQLEALLNVSRPIIFSEGSI